MSFDIKTMDDLRRVMIMAQGGDPDARQALTDFMRFDNSVERTNLPTRKDVQRVIFCLYAGTSFFPDLKNNPFMDAAETIAQAFMALRGNKSEQFVKMMQQTPTLSELQAFQEPERLSLRERVFGRRGGSE